MDASAEKISRSGRQLKIPSKFAGEVVDFQGLRKTVPSLADLQAMKKAKMLAKQARLSGKRPRTSTTGSVDLGSASGSGLDIMAASDQLTQEESERVMAQLEKQARSDLEEDVKEDPTIRARFSGETAASVAAVVSDSVPKLESNKPDTLVESEKSGSVQPVEVKKEEAVPVVDRAQVPSATPPVHNPLISPEVLSMGPPAKKAKLTPGRRGRVSTKDLDVELPPGLLESMRNKKVVTGFIAFCHAERSTVVSDMPLGSFADYSKMLSARWMRLNRAEKERWKRISKKACSLLGIAPEIDEETGEPIRRSRDKVLRDMESRLKDPLGCSPFDLLTNFRLAGEQLNLMGELVTNWGSMPNNPSPVGCLDALLDTAFVTISSCLSLMAQSPILHDAVDRDVLEDLAETSAQIIPMIHVPKHDKSHKDRTA